MTLSDAQSFLNPRHRGFVAACAAIGVGAFSVVSPSAAYLALAIFAALVLMFAQVDVRALRSLIGPAAAAILIGALWGWDGALGLLLVWRIVADARWSASELRRLQAQHGDCVDRGARVAHLWATPLFGAAFVAHTAPHLVLGLPIDLPHLPLWAPLSIGVIAALLVIDWGVRQAAQWRLTDLAMAPVAHALTHHALFLAAFAIAPDLSSGVLAMAAWRLAHALPRRVQASFTAVP